MMMISGLCALFLPLFTMTFSRLMPKEQSCLRLLLLGQVTSLVAAVASLVFYLIAQRSLLLTALPGLFELRFDWLALTMSIMIGFVSSIVVAYSERQLVGERIRVRFIRTIVCLAVTANLLAVANTLLLCGICWVGISFFLVKLTGMRAGTESAGRTVLAHHLLSDGMFLSAMALIYSWYGSGSLSALSASHQSGLWTLQIAGASLSVHLGTVVSLLLVASMCIKTALFPFHRWLLATLEAPTSMSGLLHAGIVNVATIMAWRFFPVLEQTPYVLALWGLMAVSSTVIGTLASSVQSDVKKKLVYSTVGQMGFMSLQCAVGALPAALFHLITHGLFKCHMFLRAGSAVSESALKRRWNHALAWELNNQSSFVPWLVVGLVATPVCFWLLMNPSASSKTALSVLILTGAIATALPSLKRVSAQVFVLAGVVFTAAVVFGRFLATGFDSYGGRFAIDAESILIGIVAIFALITLCLHFLKKSAFGRALYVHALNGFYIEECVAALKSRLARFRGRASIFFAQKSSPGPDSTNH